MEINEKRSQEEKSSKDQNIQNSPHSSEKCGSRGKYENCGDSHMAHKMEAQKRKTTTIALGVLLVVSLGLIGFETLTHLSPNPKNRTVEGSQSLLILSQEKEAEGAGLIANIAPKWKDSEGGQNSVLKETNRIQAEKINSLKRQLVEATQKLHEVKAHLFTKGDPSDRARLAGICQELVEKERHNNDLQERLARIETEKELSIQKAKRMEQTIDALAAMTDTQRETKEQAILNFQDQLERMQNNFREERNELQETISELQEKQIDLQESLVQRLNAIKKLEDEISWQYTILGEREKEIQSQAQLYTISEKNLSRQLQDLNTARELGVLQNQSLKGELDVSLAKFNAQKQYGITLEERIHHNEEKFKKELERLANSQLALAEDYIDLQGLLSVYANTQDHFANKQTKLANLVKEEKTRAEKLQKELEKTLAKVDAEQQRGFCLEEELHATDQKVHMLQDEIASQHTLLEKKQQELDTLTFTTASLKDQLHEKINQLTASLEDEQERLIDSETIVRDLTINLELEKTRTRELSHHLDDALTSNHQQLEYTKDLEEELSKKSEILAALEDRILDKQQEISELKGQVNAMTTNFEQEKLRSHELHKALVAALGEIDDNQLQISQLREQIGENTDTLTLLQDRMAEKKRVIGEMEERLADITRDLGLEKIKNEDFQRVMAVASAEKDSEHSRVTSLEAHVTNQSHKIISLEDTLANKHQEIRTLLDQLKKLSKDVDLEKSRGTDLQRELNSLLTKHESEQFKARTLERNIDDSEKQISGLLDQLDSLSSQYDQEKNRSAELEKNLFSVMSRLDQKEKALDQILEDGKVTQEEFSTLKHEIQKLQQERDQLSNNNQQQNALLLNQQNLIRKLSNDLDRQKVAIEQLKKNQEMSQRENKREIADQADTNPQVDSKDMTHTVRHGESLSSISVNYYGTPNRWIDIFNANRQVLKNKNDPLQIGTELIIPQ